jgi:hypothetical protein
MSSPAFDADAFASTAFDTNAFDLVEIGPTPDASSGGFSRRRTAAFARKNADNVNRRA